MAIEGLAETRSLCEGGVRQVVRIALTPLRVVTGATGLRRIGRIDPHTEIMAGSGVGGGGVLSLIYDQHIAILKKF